MLNPLIVQGMSRLSHIWSHPFRLSLMCVCARMYARISELSGKDVTRCDSFSFGSFPWVPLCGGAEPRVISLFKFFEKRWT